MAAALPRRPERDRCYPRPSVPLHQSVSLVPELAQKAPRHALLLAPGTQIEPVRIIPILPHAMTTRDDVVLPQIEQPTAAADDTRSLRQRQTNQHGPVAFSYYPPARSVTNTLKNEIQVYHIKAFEKDDASFGDVVRARMREDGARLRLIGLGRQASPRRLTGGKSL